MGVAEPRGVERHQRLGELPHVTLGRCRRKEALGDPPVRVAIDHLVLVDHRKVIPAGPRRDRRIGRRCRRGASSIAADERGVSAGTASGGRRRSQPAPSFHGALQASPPGPTCWSLFSSHSSGHRAASPSSRWANVSIDSPRWTRAKPAGTGVSATTVSGVTDADRERTRRRQRGRRHEVRSQRRDRRQTGGDPPTETGEHRELRHPERRPLPRASKIEAHTDEHHRQPQRPRRRRAGRAGRPGRPRWASAGARSTS